MPKAVATKFLSGPHADEFQAFMTSKSMEIVRDAPAVGEKRRPSVGGGGSGDTDPAGPPPAEKKINIQVAPDRIISTSTVAKTCVFSVKVTSVKANTELHIRDGGMKLLVNTSNAEVHYSKFTVLGGFGKGTFKSTKVDEATYYVVHPHSRLTRGGAESSECMPGQPVIWRPSICDSSLM